MINDIPALNDLFSLLFERSFGVALTDSRRIEFDLINSAKQTAVQMLMARNYLNIFTVEKPSTYIEQYVNFFVYDFISRLNTGLDTIALLINEIMRMKLHQAECSFKNNKYLKSLARRSKDSDQEISFHSIVDKNRQDWYLHFFEIRNLVIHRAGFSYLQNPIQNYPIQIQIELPKTAYDQPIPVELTDPLKWFKPAQEDYPILLKFLLLINSNAVTGFLTVNPLTFLDELWCKYSVFSQELFFQIIKKMA
ncbi:MAG TPA: Cthe_2314 family HEPN domain-containing protein [Anaerolineaceae bacterium]|nr:Cthe_2314 family HEPN domain-containing protein [Anaerolineaceae bacterium]HOR83508.1 Cthe_2314 family HEPN domain-containing protein [Anaerolineaceae bacterium]HPL42788.1 Cthe_2314 family HEPN domain-containing protein [Anaerolineaceae bacterium]HPY33730.1 Cthe_2314 family HEPN domain-containing protein [Anaerolineaceae bacterium]HQC20735.1 Cthe_2314 family HEPN domain-containing protein [Anaerolineaceae bacterium]